VAKGLAWIFAKLTGMDAAEMVRIVEEDHVTRNNQRNTQWEANQNKRNEQYNTDMAAIDSLNQNAHASIDAIREEAIAALDEQYNSKQDARQNAYDKEVEQMEADRLAAEKEFNDAIKEAADIRAKFETDKEKDTKRAVKKTQQETLTSIAKQSIEIAKKETKISAAGTFNAAAAQGLQAQAPMEKIAKNTEETAKYAKKSYEKNNIAVAS
jgi:hypothetical protein